MSEWLSPPDAESDDIMVNGNGRVHVFVSKLRDRNHGPSLVLQTGLHGAKENWIGEPTAVDVSGGNWRWTPVVFTDIYQLVDVDFWVC